MCDRAPNLWRKQTYKNLNIICQPLNILDIPKQALEKYNTQFAPTPAYTIGVFFASIHH